MIDEMIEKLTTEIWIEISDPCAPVWGTIEQWITSGTCAHILHKVD